MSKSKNTARNLEWLALYNSGKTFAEIASMVGYSANNVYIAIKQVCPEGLKLRNERKQRQETSSEAEYITKQIHGHIYVLRRYKRLTDSMPQPDFIGTGMALCAVLRQGETLNGWYRDFKYKMERKEAV